MTTDKIEQDNGEIGKEPDKTNPENLPDYIQPFIHLFNKKRFEKLPERQEWDHKINLTDEAPKELNAKAYTITLKKEKALNQWLDKQLKVGLIVESKSRYTAPCFYIPCCNNYLSQRQMITQVVNLLSQISSGKFTRELNKESLLN